MITILVVGRNDGYGVNLHKRTAISLNYLATLCADSDDEIVYVDCNTPEHDLTLVEAIADTLTPEARRRIRAFRVTGEQMLGAIGATPLPFSDELSRNVGIRRSNPRNRWLLSTNCDVLIQPVAGTFRDVLDRLKPRFHVACRVSIPIPQWQMLDRMDVGQISEFIDATIRRGFRFPAEQPQEWLRFGSIGDFQLAPREQWFAIRGCEEGMKLWGHSDASNSKRLSILNGGGRTPDLNDELRVMHLDHNPVAAASHQHTLVNNDWKSWVEDVTDHRSRNPDNWGLADVKLAEIRLSEAGNRRVASILKAHPRHRSFLAGVRLRIAARFWKAASAVSHRLEKKSKQG